jgi:hypothetical protein
MIERDRGALFARIGCAGWENPSRATAWLECSTSLAAVCGGEVAFFGRFFIFEYA